MGRAGVAVAVVVMMSVLAMGEARAQLGPNPGEDPTASPHPSSTVTPWWQKHSSKDRSGVMLALSLGLGLSRVDEIDGAIEFSIRLGWIFKNRLGLCVDLFGALPQGGQREYGLYAATIEGQAWVAPRLWLLGGLGVGGITRHQDDHSTDDSGTAFNAGIGYELIHNRKTALDVGVRTSGSVFSDATSAYLVLFIGGAFMGN